MFCFCLFCFFYFKKKIQKHWKFSKKDKNIFFVSSFIFLEDYMNYDISLWFRTCLILWKNLNSMCYISAKLFLILCEYVLICTYTQGLIKKLIFLFLSLYSLVKHCHALHLHCSFSIICDFLFFGHKFFKLKRFLCFVFHILDL